MRSTTTGEEVRAFVPDPLPPDPEIQLTRHDFELMGRPTGHWDVSMLSWGLAVAGSRWEDQAGGLVSIKKAVGDTNAR